VVGEGPLARILRDGLAGAQGVGAGWLGASAQLGGATGLRTAASELEDAARHNMPADPTFIDKLAAGAGSTALFFVPGMGIARAS